MRGSAPSRGAQRDAEKKAGISDSKREDVQGKGGRSDLRGREDVR